jgi:KaiC/GvpD/RAD55 family RecA-like ATPase
LSKKIIDNFNIYNQDSWIGRDLDKQLKVLEKSGLTIVSGESGNGKTIACYKYLTQHIQNGGYGFILKDEIIRETLEISFDKSLVFFIQKKLVAYINFIQEIRNETVHGRPAILNEVNSVRAKILGVAQESVLIELVKYKKMITK